MYITFKTRKMARIFNSFQLLVKEYGSIRAHKIKMRLNVLEAAEHLGQVPVAPPDRRHELKGEMKGMFAVDISANYRLIFRPDHDPLPVSGDGGVNLQKVTDITILSVEDYHHG